MTKRARRTGQALPAYKGPSKEPGAGAPLVVDTRTPRERSLANLELGKFKPGQSGNPSGRPKGVFRAAALKQLLKRAGKDGATALEQVVAAQIEKALKSRDTRSAEWLRDSVDGRPSVETGGAGEPVTINIAWPMPSWVKGPGSSWWMSASPEQRREWEEEDRRRRQDLIEAAPTSTEPEDDAPLHVAPLHEDGDAAPAGDEGAAELIEIDDQTGPRRTKVRAPCSPRSDAAPAPVAAQPVEETELVEIEPEGGGLPIKVRARVTNQGLVYPPGIRGKLVRQ